jgi:NAD(P)-dependent dehydrogenase (short-subunit alcohol dehydrogenase family)
MNNQKTVLVTGVSSGVGKAIAQLLSSKGLRVFGTSRNLSSISSIPGITALPLDVTSDESVQACISTVIEQAGHLDILVNNAGYLLAGAIEEVTMEQAHQQFETNFYGVLRTIKASLPLMRSQKSGQIITIGSQVGLTPIPYWGLYNASKFALEGLMESLRYELKSLKIEVSLVEPGHLLAAQSNFSQSAQVGANPIEEYAIYRERAAKQIEHYEATGLEPRSVAETIWHIISSRSPRLRHPIGKQVFGYRAKLWLPESMYEAATHDYYNLDGKKKS